MVPDAALALQSALFARLMADGNLLALCDGRIHDRRPESSAFPHVVIGEANCVDDGSKSRPGQVHSLTLHVWSRYRGKAQAKQILAALGAALHCQPLTLGEGSAWVNGRVTYSAVLDDPDGVTSHGVLRLRVVTEAV